MIDSILCFLFGERPISDSSIVGEMGYRRRLVQHTEQPKIRPFDVWKKYQERHNGLRWTHGKSRAIGIDEIE